MTKKLIPDIVIGRLPLYLRVLQGMEQDGRQITSSQELGELLGISAAQIRKDLSQFGEFGKQGTGYNIPFLSKQLKSILKLDDIWDIAIVGAGEIGNALARYQGFHDRGFNVSMIFDSASNLIGKKIGEFYVKDSKSMVTEIQNSKVKIAMVAVPSSAAQEVANDLVNAGVKAILNYAPINLTAPPDVRVQYIDPTTHLQRMTYYL